MKVLISSPEHCIINMVVILHPDVSTMNFGSYHLMTIIVIGNYEFRNVTEMTETSRLII
jgi:hypothetical protein